MDVIQTHETYWQEPPSLYTFPRMALQNQERPARSYRYDHSTLSDEAILASTQWPARQNPLFQSGRAKICSFPDCPLPNKLVLKVNLKEHERTFHEVQNSHHRDKKRRDTKRRYQPFPTASGSGSGTA
ncbi:hypothetical protein M422DRAFT_33158 [Sphaerobolus stellatus SS14]|uniref:Uncharacterized protein n=1 Tax=Sphaerobolus stellatus (strain SS14) TaxID=990650 RepID=A0A0C9VB53_SPHS4|nr:hypothetical protein M422DRAFT_33158 [Sphaerobolus stellatus SS14]